MRNAKDTDLQRYAVILLLWLKNAAHFMQKFISWYRRSPQTITATSFLTSDTSKQWGEREIKRSLRRNDERVEGQRHSDLRQLQQSREPAHLRWSQPLPHVQANRL